MLKLTLTIALVLNFAVFALQGQSPRSLDSQDDYEANAAYPFGRLNPEAPPETIQFAFLIGTFECKDRVLNPANGKWFDMNAVRGAGYVLNGHAIQDKNYNNIVVSTNIRIFDPAKKEWVVSYFKAPFGVGVWKGKFTDGKFEGFKDSENPDSVLSFFDISESGYSWKGERLRDGKRSLFWEFRCTRRTSN